MAMEFLISVICVVFMPGVDNQIKVWDIRMMRPLHAYFSYSPAKSLEISQRGLLAVGYGRKVQAREYDHERNQCLVYYFHRPILMITYSFLGSFQIWQDALRSKQQTPYMSHTLLDGVIEDLAFCPYEDIMGIGHSGGISTMLVPGAGEPNFDSYVANPFQSRRERQEQEVHMLLDKLQPETIVLDPDSIGR